MAKALEKFASPEFLHHYPDYKQLRDCFKGERAIKEAGTAYLPQLKGQSLDDYQNYLRRALFFPITGKTVTSMVGMGTTKAPKIDAPKEMEHFFKDDGPNYQFTETYVNIFTEVTLMGRYGILIDAHNGELRPVPYIAENIVRWTFKDETETEINSLLLREYVTVPTDEKFGSAVVCQYRHCFLQDDIYFVEVLDDDLEVKTAAMAPLFTGAPINFIPYTPFGASGIHYQVDKPPMLDISTINISHYLTSADLEWGRHIVGLPTPVVSGVDSGTFLQIGGTKAWILPVVEAKAYYLEFQGQGLGSLETAMKDKVGLMASISARLVDSSTRGSEAAETVRLRYMSESASLIHIINSIESGCMMMYNMMAKLKRAGTVTIKFSREILGVGITFKDLDVMFTAYLNNQLSKESLLYNLRRLDAIDPNRTDEEELAAIKAPPPQVDPNKQPTAAPAAPTPKPSGA